MLEVLGNSPEAAKKFFADPPAAYKEDGTVDHGATADLGKDEDGAGMVLQSIGVPIRRTPSAIPIGALGAAFTIVLVLSST
jgi:hypothetical protein